MNSSMWWVFDGMIVVVLLVFMFITIKRGLLKGAASLTGFILSVFIAISLSGTLASTVYKTTSRSANIKELTKTIDDNTLIDSLSYNLEALDYNVSVNQKKLTNVLEKAKDYDKDIYKFMNNINGKKVDDEEAFIKNLHKVYGNITMEIVSKKLTPYASEKAAETVEKKPAEFTKLIPLLLDPEKENSAVEYICSHFVDAPYIYCFRILCLAILLAVFFIVSIIAAGAFGRNDTMEPGVGRHIICGIMGLCKGAAVVFGIAVIIRLSVVYGTNKELMSSYPAIDKTYAFKYIYNFLCELK